MPIHLLPYPRRPVSETNLEDLLSDEVEAGNVCCWKGEGKGLDVVIAECRFLDLAADNE